MFDVWSDLNLDDIIAVLNFEDWTQNLKVWTVIRSKKKNENKKKKKKKKTIVIYRERKNHWLKMGALCHQLSLSILLSNPIN